MLLQQAGAEKENAAVEHKKCIDKQDHEEKIREKISIPRPKSPWLHLVVSSETICPGCSGAKVNWGHCLQQASQESTLAVFWAYGKDETQVCCPPVPPPLPVTWRIKELIKNKTQALAG